jgi:hypothetical protein
MENSWRSLSGLRCRFGSRGGDAERLMKPSKPGYGVAENRRGRPLLHQIWSWQHFCGFLPPIFCCQFFLLFLLCIHDSWLIFDVRNESCKDKQMFNIFFMDLSKWCGRVVLVILWCIWDFLSAMWCCNAQSCNVAVFSRGHFSLHA